MQRTRLVRCLAAGAMGLAMLGLLPASAQAEKREPDRSEQELVKRAEDKGPQRVLVRFDSMAQRETMTQRLRRDVSGITVRHTYRNFPMIAGEADAKALRNLSTSAGVAQVSRDVVEKPHLDEAIEVTGADQVHGRGIEGSGRTVAVIDDGVPADHPFFGDRVVHEACFIGTSGGDPGCDNGEAREVGDGAADPAEGSDHGTHVAGIAVGRNPDPSGNEPTVGVAPAADLIAIRAGDDGYRIADVVAGLDHILEIREDFDIAAVNYSGGGDEAFTEECSDDDRAEPIRQLRAAGIAMVVSAGNENDDGNGHGVTAPACVPGVVGVGNSTDTDELASDSNRGPLVDVFAPGSSVISSVPGGYGSKSGTSMAAPHVAGAYALMSQRYPNEGPDDILRRLRNTGVPLSYTSDGDDFTTPRIDLAEAITELPPRGVSAGGPYETDEGAEITLNGSGRNVDSFEWDFDNDGQYDDATGANPTFDRVGQDGEYPIALRASGPGGSATDETTVTVHNVAPSVEFGVDSPTDDPKAENSTVNVTGRITDPGWLDELTGTIHFGEGTGERVDLEGEPNNDPPRAVFSFETSFDYGDNGDYTVEVCGRDDHERVCESTVVRIDNQDPTPEIDKSEAVDTPEGPTIITRRGADVGLRATTTDPGSDDLTLAWFYGQGDGEEPDRELTSLVNPPSEDPALSPSVQPRSVTDETSTSYDQACVHQVRHTAADDDGGTGEDDVYVVVQNKGLVKRTATLWYTEYLLGDLTEFSRDTLECYLDISSHMSAVLGEQTTVSTVEEARDVLHPRLFDAPENKLDRQLLAGWLNFAHGPFDIDEDIDTECNLHTDRTFEQALRDAEAVRSSGDASDRELWEQINRLEALNLCNPLPG